MRTSLFPLAALLLSAAVVSAAEIDYVRDIKPILAKNCYSCHSGGKARGRLRLDTAAAALKGGESGPAVVPGKSDASPLLDSLTGGGDIRRMPPKGPGLPEAQIALIKNWIDQGAKAPAKEEAGMPIGVGRRGEGREGDRGFRRGWPGRGRDWERRRREMDREDDEKRKKEKKEKDDD
jgi:hypothetical protein